MLKNRPLCWIRLSVIKNETSIPISCREVTRGWHVLLLVQIGWSSSYSNPSSLSTPQPSLLNNSVEKDLRLSISDEYPSDSFDSASSLPVSPRDCLVQPSPVKLFSINSTDLVSKEDTNKEPSSSTNSTLDFVQHLPPVSTFQPLQPLKKLLSVVHEVPEEMEKEDLDDCEDHCDLAMASLSMQSDTTTYVRYSFSCNPIATISDACMLSLVLAPSNVLPLELWHVFTCTNFSPTYYFNSIWWSDHEVWSFNVLALLFSWACLIWPSHSGWNSVSSCQLQIIFCLRKNHIWYPFLGSIHK